MDMNLSKVWGIVKDGKAWRATVRGAVKSHDLATEQQQQENTTAKGHITAL